MSDPIQKFNIRMIILLSSINFCILTIQCKRNFNPLNLTKTTIGAVQIFDDIHQIQIKNDAVYLVEAYTDSQYLYLKVQYSGGCENHKFILYGWSGFHKEVYPTVGELYLSHDAKGDQCEALIQEELRFLLSPLGERALQLDYRGDTIILRIFLPNHSKPFEPNPEYKFNEPCACS